MMDYGYAMYAAFKNKTAAEEWRDYARSLEEALNRAEQEVYAQAGIKEAALRELAKFDPQNPLFQQEVRNKIGEEAIEEARKAGQVK